MLGIRSAVRRARARRLNHERVWRKELPAEVGFWEEWFETGGSRWEYNLERRLDPAEPMQEPEILAFLERAPRERARILDVGAGPLTFLGKAHPTTRLEIVATDPLADEYDRLIAEHGVDPPVRTLQCRGEELLDRFPPRSFDVVYARNAIDHAADPLLTIRNMLMLCVEDGIVILRHRDNEAEREHYAGLHQWNFQARDGRFVVWSPSARHDLTEELAGEADVRAWLEPGGAQWVVATLTRAG